MANLPDYAGHNEFISKPDASARLIVPPSLSLFEVALFEAASRKRIAIGREPQVFSGQFVP